MARSGDTLQIPNGDPISVYGARKSVALFDRCRDAVDVAAAIPLFEHPEFVALVDDFQLAIERPPAPDKPT